MGTPAAESPLSSNGSLYTKQPTLDELVEHFLSAKRSLSTIVQVWRAREIVDAGREAIEENAILSAKNAFVRQAVDVQVESLQAIRHGARVVESEGHQELQASIQTLDAASARLNETLEVLRDTIVDPAFRPPDDPPTYLFDFVDEAGVNELYESIKQSMDRFDAARKLLLDTCGSFDNDLGLIRDTLDPAGDAKDRQVDNALEDVSPFPSLLYSLETHATEVASHLEGLVKHYDLCVSALKSTEGGGEAISKASEGEADQHESKLAGFGLGITKLDDEVVPQFLSEEDRINMLTVLVKDAGEVDDVVNEISDRLVDMEDQLAQIHLYMQKLRATSSRLRSGLHLLKRVMDNVPVYITGCTDFQAAWEDEKEVLATKMEEIEGLTEFYSGFARGYDGLIIEVQRRRHVKREMEKIAKSATSQIEKLYKGDLEHREDFKADQGEYLPSDIWPGLMNPPVRYEITAIDDEGNAIPELKKDVVEKALQRLAARAKAKA